MKRRYAILAPGHFANDAKTANGVIQYGKDETVAVIDPDCAGRTVRDVIPHLRSDAPIVASLNEALAYKPNALLIGTAPKGGALPKAWRDEVLLALDRGLEVVSGLHDMLGEDVEFYTMARRRAAKIWDVRKPPESPIFSGAVYDVKVPTILMVGNDCAVGKMTVALELTRAAQQTGERAAFVPTGQTGIMIAGWGTSVDRVISDFAPGAAEALILEAAKREPSMIFVEGQGSINHPAYAPVTLSLMYGSAPDALILVCDPTRTHIESYRTPTLGYGELIRLHESILAAVKPAPVIGLALNTRALADRAAQAALEEAREQTQLPVDDVVRFGPQQFYSQIKGRIKRTAPCTAF
jgi:uncharacterized NAD-dependent epimerase/dehydratase family protein